MASPLSRPRALLPLMPPRGPRLGSSRPKTAPFRPWELGAFRSCESRAELALAFEEALGTSRFISGGLFRGDEDERQETIKTPTKLVLQSSVSRRASHATAPGVLWPRGTPLTSAPFDTQINAKHKAEESILRGCVYLRRAFCVRMTMNCNVDLDNRSQTFNRSLLYFKNT